MKTAAPKTAVSRPTTIGSRAWLGPVLALALLTPAGAGAQIPDLEWRTIGTEHFRVTFPPELEPLARHAAERAEAAYAGLSEYLTAPPRGRIEILLTDHTDFSNGYASPFPYNHVVLFAKPPADQVSLAFQKDWIDLLLVHELTHVFHRDQAAWWGMAVRAVFGRVPLAWPVFPTSLTPSWSTEGLATYVESRFTGAGRVHGSFHEMVVRAAALEGELPSIDRIHGETPIWPAGHHRYVYGSLFVADLAERFGDDAPAEMVRSTARALVPPFLAFDRVARDAWGISFTAAYRDWAAEVETRHARTADSLRAVGVTPGERLTQPGRWAFHPRVSRDGRTLAFAGSNGRDEPATYLLDTATGEVRRLARRNQDDEDLGPASWLPDGRLLTAQFGVVDVYRLLEDLWLVGPDGEETRLTKGARMSEPDVAPDGRRAVATRNGGGTNQLVLVDLPQASVRPLTEHSLDRYWSAPRWAPDGARLAAGMRSPDGRSDIVVLDTLGRVTRRVTDDDAVDGAPAWSPDGRWLLFHSDRDGIFNLYAYDLRAERLLRVSRVLGGAFQPEVSPDGRWLYFSGYHADGFHIERMAFEPGEWEPAGPAVKSFEPPRVPAPQPDGGRTQAPAPAVAESRSYSPWPTLRPRYWLPLLYEEGGEGAFVGAATSGVDLVGRHSYGVGVAVNTGSGFVEGGAAYTWAGLGDPLLSLEVERDWDFIRNAAVEAGTVEQFVRSDDARALLTFRRPGWRGSAAFSVGAELAFEHDILRDPPPGVGFRPGSDTRDRLAGPIAGASFANYRVQPFSISREDGVSLGIGARVRRDLDGQDGGYLELTPRAAGYLSFPVFGFADHVLAARGAAVLRDGGGARTYAIGGVAGGSDSLYGLASFGGGSFLPVRGFEEGVRRGTRAWSLSVEHRFPVALVGRGHRLWPIFLDRVYGALFVDAGDAWCDDSGAAPTSCHAGRRFDPLVAAGGELAATLRLFYGIAIHARAGLAVPLRGPEDSPLVFVGVGPAF